MRLVEIESDRKGGQIKKSRLLLQIGLTDRADMQIEERYVLKISQ